MSSLSIPKEDFEKYTPVMQQYLNARHSLQGKSILLFRMGDFFEAFFDDAELIARELEITLTGKADNSHPNGRIPMAGVPAKAVEAYVAKLLEKGYRVCIAEQMADPKTHKGILPREIVKTYTPGTISELDLLSSYQNNFIAAIIPDLKEDKLGLAYADISTGEFYLTEFSSKYLNQELARINPAELLIPTKKTKVQEGDLVAREQALIEVESINENLCTFIDKSNFDYKLAEENIKKQLKLNSLDSISAEEFKLGVQAAGAIIEYLSNTVGNSKALTNAPNLAKYQQGTNFFDTIKTYQVSNYMMLDANTRRNLEITQTLNQAAYNGSLMWSIDRTCSNLGKRRLANWLKQPLFDMNAIHKRQNSIQELAEEIDVREQLIPLLNDIYDIERLANRLANESISPRECISLKNSLMLVPQISSVLNHLSSYYLKKLQNIPDNIDNLARIIDNAVMDSPSMTITEGGIIKRGFNDELDEYISLVEDSQAWLANFEEQEKEKTGIKNLKVNFNKVHGYFIEVSKANTKLVPEDYIAKQTMVNATRYITPELKDFEEKINNAESRRNGLEYKLYTELRRSLAKEAYMVKDLASDIANLDALLSLARIAIEKNYSKPEIRNSTELEIQDARHPVIETKLSLGEFVANDLSLATETVPQELMILTGPNMAGKSTYMRQNAIVILLAQIGSYVPASKAIVGLTDRIFTRIGASDDLASGQSTFMVEMNETAAILNGMTEKSFIVLDEIGRGTSTYDGVAIAWSVVEYIVKSSKARTIFATHYHELADLETMFPKNIINYQMTVAEHNGKIEFLHKVKPGSADQSYGIEVAKLAGLPKAVLKRAKNINTQLQSTKKNLVANKQSSIKAAVKDDGSIDISKLPLFDKGFNSDRAELGTDVMVESRN